MVDHIYVNTWFYRQMLFLRESKNFLPLTYVAFLNLPFIATTVPGLVGCLGAQTVQIRVAV